MRGSVLLQKRRGSLLSCSHRETRTVRKKKAWDISDD